MTLSRATGCCSSRLAFDGLGTRVARRRRRDSLIRQALSIDYTCRMQLSVAEYAKERGISRQRTLALINAGKVEANKVGQTWVIDRRQVGNRSVSSRPLSARMAGLFIEGLSGGSLAEMSSEDRFHVKRYIERIRESDDQPRLLHSWLRSRQSQVFDVAANPVDLVEIAADSRLVPSGISDGRSGLSATREFEGYVAERDVDAVLKSNLLVASSSPNVRLHVVGELPSRPVPLGFVLADLADWNRAREDGRVRELVGKLLWSR